MKKIKMLCLLLIMIVASIFLNIKVDAEEPFYNITGLYLKSNSAKIGDKVYVDLAMIEKDETTEILGYFGNGQGSYVTLPLKDITSNNPYFEISSYMQAGTTYTMTVLEVKDSKDKISYSMSQGSNLTYMNPLGKNIVTIEDKTKITDFKLISSESVNTDGKLKFYLKTDKDVNFATILLQNKEVSSSKALVSIKVNVESEVDLSKLYSQTLFAGDYYVSDVFINPDNQSEYVHYSINPQDDVTKKLDFSVNFKIVDNEEQILDNEEVNSENKELLESISLLSNTVKLNEKIFVELKTSEEIKSATLIFSNDSDSFTVNLKDINTNSPYFVVPFTTNYGTYELDYVILKDSEGKEYHYRKGEDLYSIKHFEFNSSLKVENESSDIDILNIDNDKINSDVINKLNDLESNIAIEVDANNNPIISKEVFDSIKGQNKTVIIKYKDLEWIFNGIDIKDSKQIDVSSNIYDIKEESDLKDIIKDGFVIDFADNDILPGKCLIKVYNSEFISRIFNNKNINIYYYNQENKKFEIIELNSKFNNNEYYEFYINHNSKYILTTDKVEDEYILEDNVVNSNNSNNNTMIVPIVVGICFLVIVIAIVLKIKKK